MRAYFGILLACVLAFGSATGIAGDLSTTYFRIDVANGSESAFYEVLTADVAYDPDAQRWSWASSGAIPLGEVAVLNSANLTIVGDPQIALNFAMTAGPLPTTVTITTAVLSFGPYSNPVGLASAGITLTESNGDTALLTGLGGSGNAYVSLYNVPPGTVFAEFIPQVYEPDAGGSTAASGSTPGWVPIAGSVFSMQAQFSFELSAYDQASGTSIYAIVPEPAALVLLAVGGMLTLRRR